jgi:carbon storage regulator
MVVTLAAWIAANRQDAGGVAIYLGGRPMLVLTRKDGQSLVLTDETTGLSIRVTVVRINGHTVKLGVEAPEQITVLRDELVERDDERDDTTAYGPVPHLRGPRSR